MEKYAADGFISPLPSFEDRNLDQFWIFQMKESAIKASEQPMLMPRIGILIFLYFYRGYFLQQFIYTKIFAFLHKKNLCFTPIFLHLKFCLFYTKF